MKNIFGVGNLHGSCGYFISITTHVKMNALNTDATKCIKLTQCRILMAGCQTVRPGTQGRACCVFLEPGNKNR